MEEAVRDALFPGERILWQGRPRSGLLLRPIDAFLVPFSLFWGGFAIYWNLGVWNLNSDNDFAFNLFGLPFLIIGVYVIAGRFLFDMWIRARQLYLVTDRRVLVLRSGLGGGVKSLDIKHLPTLELNEGRDGIGTIRFCEEASFFLHRGSGFDIWQPTLGGAQFLKINEARKVFELIQRQAYGQ